MSEKLHTEGQGAMWWVHVLVLICAGGSIVGTLLDPAPGGLWWLIVPVALLIAIYGVFTPMTVTVSPAEMEVRFGHFGWPRWRFLTEEIGNAQVMAFRPLRDFGGWGIRFGRSALLLNERGDSGVWFTHAGRAYIVGSDDSERLLRALQAAGAGMAD